MKILVYSFLFFFITLFYLACTKEDNADYSECSPADITNILNRENEVTLDISDWPIAIRQYIATEFVTYSIREMSTYTFSEKQYFLVQMNTRGYVLFGSNAQFICADASFNGGIRLDVTQVDTSDMMIDTMDMMIDTLINLIEVDTCQSGQISFYREVLPLIVSGCAYSGCHDASTATENVILENYSQIRSKVNPSNVNNSKIIQTFNANPSSNKYMPPQPALAFTTEQQQLIKDWISQGALENDCNIPCKSAEDTSFSQDVYPLLANTCIGCHQTTNAQGGVNLDTYEDIKFFANEGSLLGSIKHEPTYSPMPQIALKMTDCQIAQIENWITQGALNN